MRAPAVLVVALALAGCPRPRPAPPPGPPPGPPRPPPTIEWRRVLSPGDVPPSPPAPGTWRVHLIDVGTGLSLLVQGADFTLLFDAGTGDPDERPLRVVAYLTAALGPSGDGECSESGTAAAGRRTIDHVVLSHPHQDHASALELVLHCFDVHDVWDAGVARDTAFYRDFLLGVAHAAGATYHTAAPPPRDRTVRVRGEAIVVPPSVRWVGFGEGDRARLGARAGFEVLHAEGKPHADANQESIVLAVALGRTRLLLTGDAESGPRADPSAPLGDVEEHLVDRFRRELDADILQVGHHGSLTSSRRGFLAAVTPRLALVSSGPKRFGRVRLPDAPVLAALAAAGATVLRTDAHDGACDVAVRLGGDHGPGGCDSYVITVDDRGRATQATPR